MKKELYGGAKEERLYEKLLSVKPPLDLLDGKELDKIELTKTNTYNKIYHKSRTLSVKNNGGDAIIYTNPYAYDSVIFSVNTFASLYNTCQNYWVVEKLPNAVVVIVRLTSLPDTVENVALRYQEFVKKNIHDLFLLSFKDGIEFFKSIGIEIYTSEFTEKQGIALICKNQYTPKALTDIFNQYSSYSELDYLSFDWSDYDAKLYHFVESSKFEIGANLHIENNKVVVTQIQNPQMPGATVVRPLDFINFHIHPGNRYDGLFVEMPSIQDIINIMERHIMKQTITSFVAAKEGTYIITFAKHLSRYGFDLYDNLVNQHKLADLYAFGPISFELFISRLKRACMNCGIILYFRPASGFNTKQSVLNHDARRLKYKDSELSALTKKIESIKSPEDLLKLDYSEFDNIYYIYDRAVLFWLAFDGNKAVCSAEDDIVFPSPFNEMSSEISWTTKTDEYKIALVYFPVDVMLRSGIHPGAIKHVFNIYTDMEWMVFASPSYIMIANKNGNYGDILDRKVSCDHR